MNGSMNTSTENRSWNVHKPGRYCESSICAGGDCGKADQDCMELIAESNDPKIRQIAKKD